MDSNLPTLAPEADPAAQAFGRLAEKVSLLEAAIAGLAAKREAAPDYSETLGEIAALLQKMRDATNTLARRPAMQLTPDAMAEQITAAGRKARAEDGAMIQQARERIDGAAHYMEWLAGTVVTAREQRRRLSYGRRAAACSRGCCYGQSSPVSRCGSCRKAGTCPRTWRGISSVSQHFGKLAPVLCRPTARSHGMHSPMLWRS